ncbi:MAG TPA: Wzz/FepE/Etk N-terminal domain-containing protein, partial [Verrucomicrobiae bacterium]
MSRHVEAPSGFSLGDIYFVVFRHKWKIFMLTLLGLAAAGTYFFLDQPLFQSQAKIFIRYISDSHALNPSDNNTRVTSLIDMNQNVVNSEMEILTSYDLAAKVATNFGPEKVMAKIGGGNSPTAAAATIKGGLRVESTKDSSVIYVTFRHADPDLVQPVLGEVISAYLEKHAQVHKALGISDEVMEEKISQLRMEIAQTEDELRIAKTNAGIISVAETEKSLQDESSRIRRELFQARASQFEHQTSLRDLARAGAKVGVTNLLAGVPAEKLSHYRTLCTRLNYLERRQNDYLQQGFTDENRLIKEVRDQIAAATKDKTDMETA